MSKSGKLNRTGRYRRTATGQGIIEGVCGLLLITIGVVLFVGLMINVGFSSYCKIRLGFVCDQTANYAASLASNNPQEDKEKITKFAVAMLNHMGFNGDNTQVKAENKEIAGEEYTSVEISTEFPVLQQLGGVFPVKISLTERSLSVGDSIKVAGYLKFALPPSATSDRAAGLGDTHKNLASNVTATNELWDEAMGPGSSKQEAAFGIMVPIVKANGLTAHAETKNHTLNKPILHAGTKETSGIGMGGEHQDVVYAHPTKSII